MRKLVWQDYTLVGVIVIYLAYQVFLLSTLKQLPSPVYGGDYYFQSGAVQHAISGGGVFKSTNVLGSEPGYLPLYTLGASLFGILGLSAFVAMMYFSIFILIASVIVFYLFANKLFKNKSTALLSVLLYLPLFVFPVWKYRQFTSVLVLPAFLWACFHYYEKKNVKSAVPMAIMLGLLGISHSAGFAFGVCFTTLLFVWMAYETIKHHEPLIDPILGGVVVAVISIPIALLYWYGPIFIHHLAMPNSAMYSLDFSTIGLHFSYVFDTIKEYLWNYTNLFLGIRSVLFIMGIVSLFFLKGYDASKKFLFLLLFATFATSFHEIITEPLFHTSFSPIIIAAFVFPLTAALIGSSLFDNLLGNITWSYKDYQIGAILIVILLIGLSVFRDQTTNDTWIKQGQMDLAPHQAAMQKWVRANTGVDDVFLTTNELGFALNGLTGRKLVTSRRAQNSPYLDLDKRMFESAVMLYGSNDAERIAFLKSNGVKYVYWDYYWIQSDFQFNEQGQLVGKFDPLTVSLDYEQKLIDNNLTYMKTYDWLDPTVHEPLKKQDFFIIAPAQFNMTHPWNNQLDAYLTEVWNYTDSVGQVLNRIYEVKY
jgi:hypothetical protein